MISDKLSKAIEEIPGDKGFWSSSCRDSYIRAAERLASLGMSDKGSGLLPSAMERRP